MFRPPLPSLLLWCFILSFAIGCYHAISQSEERWSSVQLDWSMEQVDAARSFGRAHDRKLQEIMPVKGVPLRFTIRPIIDPSLCVHRVRLTSSMVEAARAANGLPRTDAHEVQHYGSARLVLLPCKQGRTDVFLAEAILGRFYQNNAVNYRQGFLKPPSDNGVCAYGVNASYTDGHPVFGVTGTEYYSDHSDAGHGANTESFADDDEMDWFDDYTFEYASYIRYGYDPASMNITGSFKSPNPLPSTMLDASGWGPFHTSWGPCMANPTVDSATPDFDPASEVELRYHSWIFVDLASTAAESISHLPRSARRNSYALLTLGPDRPQPDVSPLAGEMDAGNLSAILGGGDKPYGTGYSFLVSNELCMTVHSVREGAQVRLAQCNPVLPSLEQVFQLVPLARERDNRRLQANA